MPTTEEHIAAHEAAGRRVEVDGVTTFLRDEGEGAPVLLVHGVPVSSFVYRRLVAELAGRGLRAIAPDLPGCGLADRPEGFDYSWTGLGRYLMGLIEALDLERFHLVVHDIGGPVGFEIAAAMPARVASMTVLNTLIEVSTFRKPWPMRPFEIRGLGEVWLKSMVGPLYTSLMYRIGIAGRDVVPPEEVVAHLRLNKRGDGGRAFLRIMRSFEPTPAKQALYVPTIRDAAYPVQVIWGTLDKALTMEKYGAVARRLVGPERFHEVPGKHFVQETEAPFIAERVAALATR